MKADDKKIDLDDVTGSPQPGEKSVSGYDEWKERQVRAALRDADANPENGLSHDEAFGPVKAKFRP